ncbi:MAG: Asp-tRNA(Asn)/Glu-tRNA(Gln) amidotransferase GatCAB subunit B, partial [Thiothrix sp.]|nr:Asp-tRNA(Asn)/Glu-tRNA(Gln) amidotransferase GatCAB subunit B [Thiothrix sp.]
EDAHDYRYFPDPDLLPLEISPAEIEAVRADMPELPERRKQRFMTELGLSEYDADLLVQVRELADYFETVAQGCGDAKLAANWVNGEVSNTLNAHALEPVQNPVSAAALVQLLVRIQDNTVSNRIARDVFAAMWAGEGSADTIIEQKGLKQITDTGAIEAMIDAIIADNPAQVAEYRAGKEKLFGFFVGQAMKASRGKANPAALNEMLKKKLEG